MDRCINGAFSLGKGAGVGDLDEPSGRCNRRGFNPQFKAKMALAAMGEDKTLATLCQQIELPPNQITEWKKLLLANAAGLFGTASKEQELVDLGLLYKKIGQQALEIDFSYHPFCQLVQPTSSWYCDKRLWMPANRVVTRRSD